MARSADETARVLIEIYTDSYSYFKINWPDLRSLAGVKKLTKENLQEINGELNESGYHLVPMDNFLLVADESDFGAVRSIPPRIVEGYLPGDENDDDDDTIDFGDDEDDEVVEDEDDDSPPSRD